MTGSQDYAQPGLGFMVNIIRRPISERGISFCKDVSSLIGVLTVCTYLCCNIVGEDSVHDYEGYVDKF